MCIPLSYYIGTYWYSHWSSNDGRPQQKHATFYYVWSYHEQGQSDVLTWHARENSNFTRDLQVRVEKFSVELGKKTFIFPGHWPVAAFSTILKVRVVLKLKDWGWSLLTLWNLTITLRHNMSRIL